MWSLQPKFGAEVPGKPGRWLLLLDHLSVIQSLLPWHGPAAVARWFQLVRKACSGRSCCTECCPTTWGSTRPADLDYDAIQDWMTSQVNQGNEADLELVKLVAAREGRPESENFREAFIWPRYAVAMG